VLPLVPAAGGGVEAGGGTDTMPMEADVGAGFEDGERGETLVVGDVEGVNEGAHGGDAHVDEEGAVFEGLREGGREECEW